MAKTSAEMLNIDRRIWDYRLAGLGTAQIASALDMTPAQLAKRMERVKRQIEPEIRDAAKSHVALQYARLERMIRALWPQAIGNPGRGKPGDRDHIPKVPPDQGAIREIAALMRDQSALLTKSIGSLPAAAGTSDAADQAAANEDENAEAARSTLADRIDRLLATRAAQGSSSGS